MQITALYIRASGVQPVTVHVRLHNHWGQVGDIRGSRTYPAEAENLNPKMIFDLSEITTAALVPGGIVSVEAGEAYKVDHVMPADDEFQTVAVVKLPASQAAGLPLPPPEDTTFDSVTIPTVAEAQGAGCAQQPASVQPDGWVDPATPTEEERIYTLEMPPDVNGGGGWLR